MNNIAEELRDIADKAEAGEKLHWAKAMRAGALQLDNWRRDIDTYRLRLDHHDAQSAQLGEVLEENERLRSWIDEALSYVGCTTWSPSLEAEGRALLTPNVRVQGRGAGFSAERPLQRRVGGG